MNVAQLKGKASKLPFLPGVYIMKDQNGQVIYVGKAKKLKNRVSQYFQDSAAHSAKTLKMVSNVWDFDVIICSTEFEALVLECAQIKQHKPKYNILLKDDKGFPYIRIDSKEKYPRLTVVGKIADDGAEYFGPYGSRSATKAALETILKTLRLPTCNRQFPRDIGKYRVCLNYHLKQCAGWCQTNNTNEMYLEQINRAKQLLSGKYRAVSLEIERKMLDAAEAMNFELAASLRDQLKAVNHLKEKQLVTNGKIADVDVIGFSQTELKACFAVLHFNNGTLIDKEYEILDAVENPEYAIASLIKQYYTDRRCAPKTVYIPVVIEDCALLSVLLEQEYHVKTSFTVPQRGEKMQLVKLAQANAAEEALHATDKDARSNKVLQMLGDSLNIPKVKRIESYDISNISGTDNVGSMVVFLDGKPRRSEYKHFKIRDIDHQDDYGSMEQVIKRRFEHYKNGDSGFADRPDLVLIDGGANHGMIAKKAIMELGLDIPVFGMVKDDRHRTRALITPNGSEIRIDHYQSIFSLIGNIQEETHRFAISYHKTLRSKRLRYSVLDSIDGVGPKRKQALLKTFKSISAISKADVKELERILPANVAYSVYKFFEQRKESDI